MSVEKKLDEEFDNQVSQIAKVNIMVVGGTGVGKSSLINTVFGENVAQIGAGKPVTKGVEKFESDNLPITIFDTEGYEIIDDKLNSNNFETEVITFIEDKQKCSLKDQIHLFWYCISAGNHRITEYDLNNIKLLSKNSLKLAIVITQCDKDELDSNDEGKNAQAFRKILIENGVTNPVYQTMTQANGDYLELDRLLEWSAEVLKADALQASFVGAQSKNIGLKDSTANNFIIMAIGASAAAGGANPLPLSDAFLISPIQMALAVKLANIYGFTNMGENVLALLKAQVVSMIGRQMAASLTKLIPVIGQVINAGVAGAITAGFGYGMKSLYRSAYLEYLDTGDLPNWLKLFNSLDLTSFIKSAETNK